MHEGVGNQSEHGRLGDAEYVKLGKRISEGHKGFHFPELREDAYAKLKSESEEFPDLMVHIDVIVEMMKESGIQVYVETNGNVFILPRNLAPTPNNVRDYSIIPKYLNVTPNMDPDLKRLILARR